MADLQLAFNNADEVLNLLGEDICFEFLRLACDTVGVFAKKQATKIQNLVFYTNFRPFQDIFKVESQFTGENSYLKH